MSRAFVKEDSDPHGDDLPERPIPPGPNYVTPEGKAALARRLEELSDERRRLLAGDPTVTKERRRVERELRYYETRLRSAVVIDPARQEPGVVRFGARVTVAEPDGTRRTFRIVGHDEAEPEKGTVSWSSPLAAAVLGAKPGERVTWEQEAGAVTLEILSAVH